MKTLKRSAFALAAIALVACGGPEGQKVETEEAKEVKATNAASAYTVDLAASTVNWTGSKLAGDHTGTLAIQGGSIEVMNNQIVGGSVVFDMDGITNTDMEGEYSEKLVGHLKSEDFFDVAKYPTAKFEITSVSSKDGNPNANMSITGNLTLKDVTKSISFDALVKVAEGTVQIAAPDFTFDRTEFNVKYGSTKFFDIVKDKAVYDEIGVNFTLVAKQ